MEYTNTEAVEEARRIARLKARSDYFEKERLQSQEFEKAWKERARKRKIDECFPPTHEEIELIENMKEMTEEARDFAKSVLMVYQDDRKELMERHEKWLAWNAAREEKAQEKCDAEVTCLRHCATAVELYFEQEHE